MFESSEMLLISNLKTNIQLILECVSTVNAQQFIIYRADILFWKFWTLTKFDFESDKQLILEWILFLVEKNKIWTGIQVILGASNSIVS